MTDGRAVAVADIGGTHARFAVARIAGGRVVALDAPVTLRSADHAGLPSAWAAFAAAIGRAPPRDAAIAVAAHVGGEAVTLTNLPWTIRPAGIVGELGLDRCLLVNDFGAIGHAVATAGEEWFAHEAGPDLPLAGQPVIGIVGPGTGLGVALVVRGADDVRVIETEGGHVGFAPLDTVEDAILAYLRPRYGRVSAERIVSGPGLANIRAALGAIEGRAVAPVDDGALWAAALDGADPIAAAALERFCLCLGSVAGDIALAQGATAMVLAGGLSRRLATYLPRSGFAARFVAKGRFERQVAAMPVKRITHPQPGLLGAAAAFAAHHG